MTKAAFLLIVASLIPPAPAKAQNTALPPSYGSADFTAHPPGELGHVVALEAGGNRRAEPLGRNCAGIIADAPDYRFRYRANNQDLHIRTEAASPITLIVNDAAGAWQCAVGVMDGGRYTARLSLPGTLTGTYDIWVGTMTAPIIPARLVISETPAAAPPDQP